jgi:hypothetical protein
MLSVMQRDYLYLYTVHESMFHKTYIFYLVTVNVQTMHK